MRINFHFNETSPRLSGRIRLKAFLKAIFDLYRLELQELNYIFCTDAYLLGVNQRFLQHDDYTDIITFSLSDPGEPVIGEVYISIDRVKENAIGLKIPFYIELHRVIFHGALHLCGLNDKNPREKKRMTQAEDHQLANYFENVPRETFK